MPVEHEGDPRAAVGRREFVAPLGARLGGTFEDRIMVRLPQNECDRLIKAKKASTFEPMPGRPMKAYVSVPAPDARDAKRLTPWLARALAHTLTLPAKDGPKKATAGRTARPARTSRSRRSR